MNEEERSLILKALSAGGVPPIGLHHLTVAREAETRALGYDIDTVAAGGSAFRILKGAVGSGKTFMQNLAREIAINANLVVGHTEFGIDHRLYGSDGRSRAFQGSLMSHLFTASPREPGALRRIIEIWIDKVAAEIKQAQGTDDEVKEAIFQRLRPLNDHENGYAFAQVLVKYHEGYTAGRPEVQDAAARWLRAEFSTLTEARTLLNVRSIIKDQDIYPALKVFALFCRIAGYAGLYLIVDELSALTERLSNSKAREGNFHTLLKIMNESAQGRAPGLGFLIAGTDSAVENEDMGLFSYLPLRSRLRRAENDGETKYSPIIPLEKLGYEHLYELLRKIVRVHALDDPDHEILPADGIKFFMEQQLGGGSSKKQNPRDVIRPFVELLDRMEAHPDKSWPAFFAKSEMNALARP